eukprot:1671011-Alexandrium_andersonii.AAC.1
MGGAAGPRPPAGRQGGRRSRRRVPGDPAHHRCGGHRRPAPGEAPGSERGGRPQAPCPAPGRRRQPHG